MSTEATTRTGTVDAAEVIERVQATELPDRVADLVAEYERVCGERDRFLWQWFHSLVPAFTLSSVDDEYREHVRTQKTILTIYVTVLDDLVETRGDRATFEAARRLPSDRLPCQGGTAVPNRDDVDDDVLTFVRGVWEIFESGLDGAPRADAFRDVFAYDLRQTTNAMAYSCLFNDNPAIANLEGATRYDAHNMAMFAYADVDLMYSSGFDLAEFGAVRDLLWDLQEMARVGNWITTWEREVHEGDFTAGVVVAALEEGVVTPAVLREADPSDVIERIEAADLERRFHEQWRERYRAVSRREFETQTVDLDALVEGMETVFQYHLATRGYK